MKLISLTKVVNDSMPDSRRVLYINPAHIQAIELNDNYESVLTTSRGVFTVEETATSIADAMGGYTVPEAEGE